MFQKSKYVYDWEKKTFHTVVFPVNKPLEEYVEAKGYADDEAIEIAEKEYGKNEMVMVSHEGTIQLQLLLVDYIIANFYSF